MDRFRLRNDIPGHDGMEATAPTSSSKAPAETGRMVVGRDVVLTGEISTCADLLVEGTVKAELKGGQHIEITETGRFNGEVEVVNAEISGFFEGTLTVKNRLVLRPSAVIKGDLFYGSLEVHPGARIEGKMTVTEAQTEEAAPVMAEPQKMEEAPADLPVFNTEATEAANNDMDDIISRISGDEDEDEKLPFRGVA